MASNNLAELEVYDSSDEDEQQFTDTSVIEASRDKDSFFAHHSAGFRELCLKPELLRAIADCGFEHPSEVQNQCIPQAIFGTDVVCQAKSGMGKTAVFVLALLQQLDPQPGQLRGLVLCHTRELAFQIWRVFERFKKYLPEIKISVFYGGVPVEQDIKTLEGGLPHIAIGTPGRILHLITEKKLPTENIKYFVVDECDSVLDRIEMRRDVQKIFLATPHEKQVMMFSATLDEGIRAICKKFMQNPLEIYVNETSKLTLHGLQQFYVELEEKAKNRKLVDLLDALDFNQLVIFVKSVPRATELNRLLKDCNFPSICIHGGIPQEERIQLFKAFKEYHYRILVSTNLLGRGIDIERVNVVINYDMAESPETYLHRVGRAGRFGTKGLAISFISSPQDTEVLEGVQRLFVVSIPTLPATIDPSTYMTA